jgi:hypothetical protein
MFELIEQIRQVEGLIVGLAGPKTLNAATIPSRDRRRAA